MPGESRRGGVIDAERAWAISDACEGGQASPVWEQTISALQGMRSQQALELAGAEPEEPTRVLEPGE